MTSSPDEAHADGLREASLFSGMLCEVVSAAAAALAEGGGVLLVEQLTVDTPMELALDGEAGALRFDATGPSQTIETSILPVFHRIRATIALGEDGNG